MALDKYWELNYFPELVINTDAVDVHRVDKAAHSADVDVARLSSDSKSLTVTVDALSTSDTTPELTGQLNSPNATVALTVDGNPYVPVNNGDGTWTLADNTVAAIGLGTYDVDVTITDPDGTTGNTPGTSKLVIV